MLNGQKLLKKNGEVVAADEVLKEKKIICYYFSAHWCPPCRSFTPILGDFYTVRGRSQTTFTKFDFFWPPTPLRLHFLWYESLQKVNFFDHLPPSSCKRSLWTTPYCTLFTSSSETFNKQITVSTLARAPFVWVWRNFYLLPQSGRAHSKTRHENWQLVD